jgi:hypothetical protein
MTGRPAHRLVEVDGETMVILDPAEFERLDASRRQVGARDARARSLVQQVQQFTALIDQVRDALDDTPPCDHVEGSESARTCLRCRLESLLAAPPRPAESDRRR